MSREAQDPPRLTRRQKAAATRQRIVESAYDSFLRDGYAGTPMTAVARQAKVAVQTVYFVFRTKGDLLQAVYEHAVLGPDGVPPHLSAWWRTVEAEPEITRAVRELVEGTIDILERAAPLVYVVLGDETARAGYEHNEELRRIGTEALVSMLAAKQPMRTELSPERARDQLLLLTGPQIYVQLTRDLQWPREQIAEWMTATILHQLFDL
ncbi:MAG: TetR/AcrR family transcriptional regulator [Nocardioides sp.]